MLKLNEFIKYYEDIGSIKTKRRFSELLLLGIFAGVILGCAATASIVASFSMPNVSLVKLVSSLIFPAGLILIIFTGSELFTGNCLISISVLGRKATLTGMLRNLGIVYLGNFIGCVVVAAICVFCGVLGNVDIASFTIMLADAKCSLHFGNSFILSIICNLMVCTGVFCALSSNSATGKAISAYLPVCLFIICGFEHSIANMYFIPAGIFATMLDGVEVVAENLNWTNFFIKNLIPVTVGNVIGGVGLGVLLWYCGGREVKK